MEHPLILFDGVCNLCDRSVQFIIRHDKKKQFRFASLQGLKGQEMLKKYNLPSGDMNSFVLIYDNKVYQRSSGALKVLQLLGGGWKLLYGFMIVPAFIRNGVYNWIARNRYRWFGKQESCWIPTPELKSRFFD
jgi:predicted DCC family thiol-disulfide oxidoreductase YuxK